MRTHALVLGCALALTASLASAAPNLPDIVIYNVELANSPIKITRIGAGWKPPDWVPAAHKTVVEGYRALPIYLQYTNQTQKAIADVRLAASFYDPFNDYLDGMRLISLDPVAAGQMDYGRWTCPTRDAWLTAAMVIFPLTVRFQDGSVWRADTNEAVRKAAMTGTLSFEPWHVVAEGRDYIGQRLKDGLQ